MTSPQAVGGHRERLLAGALECLREKGYAKTTARDIVAASGTNLASIGYHYGSKEALLQEAVAECFRAWTARVEEAVFRGELATPREMLERALVALIDVFAEVRPLMDAFVEAYAPALRDEELRAKLAAAYAETRAAGVDLLLRAAAAADAEPPFDPAAFVSVLIAISDGLMLQWLADPSATPDAHQVMDVLAGLSAFLR
ncbi:TetR/AcrR family transcriptional regulator [Actinocorallia longicatena]|uniref:TetR/AcrR family transcriptional regulator n=1 Tax=Actinocorallia longicatena TaxID=111803 RepID=UPI0031D05C6B